MVILATLEFQKSPDSTSVPFVASVPFAGLPCAGVALQSWHLLWHVPWPMSSSAFACAHAYLHSLSLIATSTCERVQSEKLRRIMHKQIQYATSITPYARTYRAHAMHQVLPLPVSLTAQRRGRRSSRLGPLGGASVAVGVSER